MFDTALLEEKARMVRREALNICARNGDARLGSAYSMTELCVALYYGGVLKYKANDAEWPDRDRFVLSKGHALVGLYPILQDLGFITRQDMDAIGSPGAQYGPYGDFIPGIEGQWGSVGHGLGVAAGIALALKSDLRTNLVVVITGDGELYEGASWEAIMFAAHHRLNNLVCIVDRNYFTTLDATEDALRLNPLADKFKAFGWDVIEIDGHKFAEIIAPFEGIRARRHNNPVCIIANTLKGRGLSQLEFNRIGHIMVPRPGAEMNRAHEELA